MFSINSSISSVDDSSVSSVDINTLYQLYSDETNPVIFNSTPKMARIETAEKCLIKFDGDRLKLREFIDNCEIALRLVSNEDQIIIFEIIKTKITGKAKLLSQNREFDNWLALKQHLENTYSEKRSQAQWELELHSCRQNRNESVRDYVTRVENCMVKLINSLDSQMSMQEIQACEKLIRTQTLNVFISGLSDTLITLVKSQKPACLEDAFDLAIAEEREIISRKETQKYYSVGNTEKKCFNCNKYGHLTKNCYMKRSTNPNHYVKTEPNFYKVKTEPVRTFQKFCKYCKNVGHEIGECRKREYNNKKKQQFFNSNHLNLKSTPNDGAVPGSSKQHQHIQNHPKQGRHQAKSLQAQAPNECQFRQ